MSTRPDKAFEPMERKNARILILGSMPGRKSLHEQQYYAHPQNAFWRIMQELYHIDAALPYAQRLGRLMDNRIALWDVAQQCVRPGSMDHAIDMATVVPNDFNTFLGTHPDIRAIFFNGRKAEELFRRLVLPQISPEFVQIERYLLPSSSPAHAGMSRVQKIEAWRIVHAELETPHLYAELI